MNQHHIHSSRVTRHINEDETTTLVMDIVCTCGHLSTGSPEAARADRAIHISNNR